MLHQPSHPQSPHLGNSSKLHCELYFVKSLFSFHSVKSNFGSVSTDMLHHKRRWDGAKADKRGEEANSTVCRYKSIDIDDREGC